MRNKPGQLRALLNERLALLVDPRFAPKVPQYEPERLAAVMEMLTSLQKDKGSFLDSYGYFWALDPTAYNSSFEALLQWRLLNSLSDIQADHPALERCANVIVRVLPTSCARPHLREVDQYRVIILTTGYLSAFKGFIRLWLRGCAIGQVETKHAPATYYEYAANYVAAIQQAEGKMEMSARAYLGNLIQLLENQQPFMDRESIFDDQVLKREQWGMQFGVLGHAIDGFLIFHEAAHILAGDTSVEGRTLEAEVLADRGSVSLCIIDEARNGGTGTVHLGAPLFFCVELLRLLVEEILEVKERRHDLTHGRYPGIDELMLRTRFYAEHVESYLGAKVSTLYREWSDVMGLVFLTARWALLSTLTTTVSLSEYVATNHPRPRAVGLK